MEMFKSKKYLPKIFLSLSNLRVSLAACKQGSKKNSTNDAKSNKRDHGTVISQSEDSSLDIEACISTLNYSAFCIMTFLMFVSYLIIWILISA